MVERRRVKVAYWWKIRWKWPNPAWKPYMLIKARRMARDLAFWLMPYAGELSRPRYRKCIKKNGYFVKRLKRHSERE